MSNSLRCETYRQPNLLNTINMWPVDLHGTPPPPQPFPQIIFVYRFQCPVCRNNLQYHSVAWWNRTHDCQSWSVHGRCACSWTIVYNWNPCRCDGMEIFSDLVALCKGKVTGGFPSQRVSNTGLWLFLCASTRCWRSSRFPGDMTNHDSHVTWL